VPPSSPKSSATDDLDATDIDHPKNPAYKRSYQTKTQVKEAAVASIKKAANTLMPKVGIPV
jgi:hypothetical protein